jgi:hypothetical protein
MSVKRQVLGQILAATCVAVVVVCSWLHPLDGRATEKVDAGLQKAMVTYGTARLLHGSISVLQGTQVNAEPGGIGATFSPGQVLAPAAEMLKQFSDVMLVVCVAFGIQKLLIAIAAHWTVSIALTLSAFAWLGAVSRQRRPPVCLTKAFVVLLMVQFAVPITVLGSDQIFLRVLDPSYQTAQQAIDPVARGTESAAQPLPPANDKRPMIERVKDWLHKQTAAPVAEYQSLKTRVEQATEHIVRLLALFVLQTIILPLLLLWALYGSTRALLRWPGELRTAGSRPST